MTPAGKALAESLADEEIEAAPEKNVCLERKSTVSEIITSYVLLI